MSKTESEDEFRRRVELRLYPSTHREPLTISTRSTVYRLPSVPGNRPRLPIQRAVRIALVVVSAFALASCSSDDDGADNNEAAASPSVSTRASGLMVTTQAADGVTVHTLTAPEAVFANSTHLIETENSGVAFDTQFLLLNAQDMRAYADELGKAIDRVFITHENPDHFLGSDAFSDLPIYALQPVAELIAANGDAEVIEKQGDFGAENFVLHLLFPAN